MKTVYNKFFTEFDKNSIFEYLVAAVLITLPLKYAFGTSSIILFLFFSVLHYKYVRDSNRSSALLLPILFYLIMILSVLWSIDANLTFWGLKKNIFFLLIPLAFLYVNEIRKIESQKLLMFYSYGMTFFSIFTIVKAIIKFINTKNVKVFFYHELVTLEVNAIYVSIFVSVAVFYFFSIQKKTILDKICLATLLIFVFLLSSKTVIFIDIIIIICYYTFFSNVPKSVRLLTIFSITGFVIFSLFYVKQIRERFLIEYETAFVDNTVNEKVGNTTEKVYNVSLKQAWCNKSFQKNHYFPGTALRVFQFRIFTEIVQDPKLFLLGTGLEASQEKIVEKTVEYNLYSGYSSFNFHNQYIQTFSEIGVFGFIILILMLVVNFKNAIKNKSFMHLVFAISIAILFLSESFFCRQRGIVFFLILYCVFNNKTQEKCKTN